MGYFLVFSTITDLLDKYLYEYQSKLMLSMCLRCIARFTIMSLLEFNDFI